MRYSSLAVLVAASAFLSATASAQEVSLRGEPGVAVLLNGDTKYLPGGSVSLKPELSFGKTGFAAALSFGPSVSYTELTTPSIGVNNEHIWGVGGFLRLKRPYDNSSKGILAMSPWADADVQYIYTERTNRAGASVGIGLYAPTSHSREVWMGPFVRYQYVNQMDNTGGLNPTSSNMLVFGFGIELARNHNEPVHSEPMPRAVRANIQGVSAPCPVPQQMMETKVAVVRQGEVAIHFNKNSAELGVDARTELGRVANALANVEDYSKIEVEGHSSSDGNAAYNMALSKRRADAVVAELVADGLPADKLSATGFGIASPEGDNRTKEGRAENRRAEFTVKFVVMKRVTVPVDQVPMPNTTK